MVAANIPASPPSSGLFGSCPETSLWDGRGIGAFDRKPELSDHFAFVRPRAKESVHRSYHEP